METESNMKAIEAFSAVVDRYCEIEQHVNRGNFINAGTKRMHRLLYFIQAYFMLETNEPCFDDIIIARAQPVVPSVTELLSKYSRMYASPSLDMRICDTLSFELAMNGDIGKIRHDQRKLICDVVDNFIDMDDMQMYHLILGQRPFSQAMHSDSRVIKPEALLAYFTEKAAEPELCTCDFCGTVYKSDEIIDNHGKCPSCGAICHPTR